MKYYINLFSPNTATAFTNSNRDVTGLEYRANHMSKTKASKLETYLFVIALKFSDLLVSLR